jgi:hypothetical protein
MILCDLCGKVTPCLPKEIEGKQYEICSACWNPLARKLKGKGRAIKEREMVVLPQQITIPEPQAPKPAPGEPPKIWGSTPNFH